MQLLASLGYENMKCFINFFKVILKNCRNEHKKYKRHKTRSEKIVRHAQECGININSKKPHANISRQSEYRIHKKIDQSINYHAQTNGKNVDELLDSWISYKYSLRPSIFERNRTLQRVNQRRFDEKSRYLWNEFKNDKNRITKLTLTYVSRRQSYRDIQAHREAVMLHEQMFNFGLCKVDVEFLLGMLKTT